MTSDDILKLLQSRHEKDVFVPECKNGPTQMVSDHSKVDAWAMAKSWAHPLVSGYEIKVSRGDFVRDEKWMAYLPMCNCLWFVCPDGLIDPSEVPEQCGLLTVAKNGGRLFTKKKAPYRDITVSESVFRYILMCRARIGSEFVSDKGAEWRAWLEEKREHRTLGYRVAREIREHCETLESENRRLKQEMKTYDDVRALMDELKIPKHGNMWHVLPDVRNKISSLSDIIPAWFQRDLERLIEHATKLRDRIPMVADELKLPL